MDWESDSSESPVSRSQACGPVCDPPSPPAPPPPPPPVRPAPSPPGTRSPCPSLTIGQVFELLPRIKAGKIKPIF